MEHIENLAELFLYNKSKQYDLFYNSSLSRTLICGLVDSQTLTHTHTHKHMHSQDVTTETKCYNKIKCYKMGKRNIKCIRTKCYQGTKCHIYGKNQP
jgi:hypothetical protein